MTDNRTTELLPCPICGKKVSIARTENEVGERWWFITRGTYRTTRCNCRLFLESEKFTCDWNDDYSLECRAKLIEKWNTRATHGMLTAEQVREVLLYHLPHREYYSVEKTDAWQAIADELNATLGRVECEVETTENWLPAERYYRCKNCGAFFAVMNASGDIPPCVCPNCGKAVKR